MNYHTEELQEKGVVKIDDFMSAASICRLQIIARKFYEEIEVAEQNQRPFGGSYAEAYLQATWRQWRGLQLDSILEVLEQHSLIALKGEMLISIYEATNTLKRILGTRCYWEGHISFFRNAMQNTNSAVRWHCDAEAAGTSGLRMRCLSLWLPLEPVGHELPSLEFVLGSHTIMCKEGDSMPQDRHRSVEWVDTIPGERWIPKAIPGDAMLFEQHTLHRTQIMPSQPKPRLNCELRFTTP